MFFSLAALHGFGLINKSYVRNHHIHNLAIVSIGGYFAKPLWFLSNVCLFHEQELLKLLFESLTLGKMMKKGVS